MESVSLILPLIISSVIAVVLMPAVINYFKKKQLGQTTREEGPSWHEAKSGTPTMGGVSILISVVATSLVFSLIYDVNLGLNALLVFIFLVFAVIGFVDDYIKVVMKRNLGLTSLQKLLAQIAGAILFYLGVNSLISVNVIQLPFGISIDLGLIYGLFVLFWLVGFSNATNLTDGIDGLLATTGTIAYITYTLIAVWQNQWEVALFTVSIVGALIGFFLFNKKPAKIFMGDVGSLALGAGLAGTSIILNQEWTLLLIGLIFVIETASVMLQVTSFKTRGKRIFKMSPIHHHFEMSGWGEWKIVIIFSAITLIMSVVALIMI
ncbi:phospho-N-acetylmuramoyl-pentapeptide-transferase [Alkalibacterium olivapovliticus]|uniref:Phospho-N-acetylmuramoyl-pentapeptide-transferase n=1 Tax=Alkalibacterium olivapovliticus TaxID=99907 RepID=A0A2T0WB84_9LACT|nr:phospho-N-acetylmuramoyl-pentapeptide-transferase [Alkalibacterium olivapovliticus]PRY83958.1 phospho-N-acetylmuramoyl-pentapeptide-transferase [Alkalibacterium olivapovliticus]